MPCDLQAWKLPSPLRGQRRTVAVMTQSHPTPEQRDERVSLPLDQETALRALLKVDPDSEPVDADEDKDEGLA